MASRSDKAGINAILVLVGLTGSGKSTFANKFVELMEDDGDSTWHRVSQDILKSKKKVEDSAARLLEGGDNVIIDRTNLSEEQRAVWVELARANGARCEVVFLNSDKSVCAERVKLRLVHEGGVTGAGGGRIIGMQFNSKNRSDPTLAEGFDHIYLSDASQASIESFAAAFRKRARSTK